MSFSLYTKLSSNTKNIRAENEIRNQSLTVSACNANKRMCYIQDKRIGSKVRDNESRLDRESSYGKIHNVTQCLRDFLQLVYK